jgi:SET domain
MPASVKGYVTNFSVKCTVSYQVSYHKSALFVFGSKIAHSCAPNVSDTSQTEDGALEYKVTRPIALGEEATFSYIGNLYQTPMYKRCEQLLNTKSFLCGCSRCSGPDYYRMVQCTGCATGIRYVKPAYRHLWQLVA